MNGSISFLEALEDRIAPASLVTLVNPSTVTYHEADGDDVTVKFSKKIFKNDTADDLSDVFIMDPTTGGLQYIDLISHSNVAAGTDITFTVKKGGSGDGLADVPEIDSEVSLGNVKIAGNLGALFILSNPHESALKSLTVNSMVNASDRISEFDGDVGSITVTGDVTHAGFAAYGNVGSITIKGDTTHSRFDLGTRTLNAKVSSFTVGGDWTASTLTVGISDSQGNADHLFGTTDDRAVGGISSIGSLTIGGHIVAGSNGENYGIEAGSFGKVTIDGVDHSPEFSTLKAYTPLALTDVTTAGHGGVFAVRVAAPTDLLSHTLLNSKTIVYNEIDGDIVTVKFSKDLFTGENAGDFLNRVFSFDPDSGIIQSITFNSLTNPDAADGIGMTFSVKKGAFGDGLADVQYIYSDLSLGAIKGIGNLDAIVIKNIHAADLALKSLEVRSMVWDSIGDTISDITGNVGAVTIKGDFTDLRFAISGNVQTLSTGDIGGTEYEGSGFYLGSAKTITVGNLNGSDLNGSAHIRVEGDVGTITTGAILGNSGGNSGRVEIDGTVTTAKLGAIQGGSGDNAGTFWVGKAGSITAASITGGSGSGTAGTIHVADGDAETSITIAGNVDGTNSHHHLISSSGNIKALTIGGSVTSASLDARNFGDIKIIGPLFINSGIYANTIKSLSASAIDHAIILTSGYAGGYTSTGVSIGSITVTHNMAHAYINAGFDGTDVKVTSVTVNGDWIASLLDVGVTSGGDGIYNNDFIQGTSQVGALTIKGSIVGTNVAGENYGIRASVFDKLVLSSISKKPIDAIAAYEANTPIRLSPVSDGTPGNGAVFIERGLPTPVSG